MLWLIGPEGVEGYDRLRAEPPREISKGFRSSGYFVMRDGWRRDSSFVLIDCGPHGAEMGCGHAHSDALSIEFASRGVTWLVDPGTFVYAADPKTRDEFRSTAAHNTVTVDDQPQSVPSDAVLVAHGREMPACMNSSNAATRSSFKARTTVTNVSSDPVTHTRSVLYLKPEPARQPPGTPDRARSIHR